MVRRQQHHGDLSGQISLGQGQLGDAGKEVDHDREGKTIK